MSLETPPPARTSGVPLTLALLSLAIAVFLISQITAAGQQSKLVNWQMKNGEKQLENAKKNEGQLTKLIEQQDVVVKQADAVQSQFQKLLDEVLKLSETDKDAKAIVEKWKIQRSDNKPAAAAEKPADKPADK
jgi:hypothetical protein